MKLISCSLLLLMPAAICCAQAASDPTLDPTGLPWVVKALSQPAPEPWQKNTCNQRLDLYQQSTFSGFAVLGSATGAAFSQ